MVGCHVPTYLHVFVGKWKSDIQKLKGEVQQKSADLKTQEQQFQQQLAGAVTCLHQWAA